MQQIRKRKQATALQLIRLGKSCACIPLLGPAVMKRMKCKGKAHLGTNREDPESQQRYSYILYLTSTLGEVRCQCHAATVLLPGKPRYPLYRRLGGSQEGGGKCRPHWNSIPGPSRPQRVAIPAGLSRSPYDRGLNFIQRSSVSVQ